MSIHSSGQDYLETIYILKKKNSTVRSIDIALEFGYSKPSVSVAMKQLLNEGYITMNGNKEIDLTEKGEELAISMYERHVFFTSWLESLGVPSEIAMKDACKIEHDLSNESFEAIRNFARKQMND